MYVLEKQYAQIFLKKADVFKKANKTGSAKEQGAYYAMELYSLRSVLLPQQKLESGKDKNALLLDMLNELQRCPRELYEHFSQADKDLFLKRIALDEDGGEDADSVLMRKENRFPYFALRCIDMLSRFRRLRFHVNLGKLTYKTYYQKIDGAKYQRRWEEPLLSFGKLDFYKEKPKEWKAIEKDPAGIDDDTPAPYITETNAHYHFEGNAIGIKIMDEDGIWPTPEFDKKPRCPKPDFYVSNNELPGMLFYDMMIEVHMGANAEAIMRTFQENVFKFLEDVIKGKLEPLFAEKITNENSDLLFARKLGRNEFDKVYKARKLKLRELLNKEYKLEPHQVPDNICKWLMGIEPVEVEARAEFVVTALIGDTKKKLERLNPPARYDEDGELITPYKKQLKKKDEAMHLRAGETALFLAKDMLYFQPDKKDEKGKTTGKANPTEFQVLQARLAFFRRDKKLLPAAMRLCGLIDSDNEHPFLKKIDLDKCSSSVAFYKAYLEERLKYLEKSFTKKNKANLYFVKLAENGPRDIDYFKSLAKRIKDQPINLPRGLFKDALIDLLKKKGNADMKNLMSSDMKHNAVFLANNYYTQNGDGYQPFYSFKRNYKNVDKIYDSRPKGSFKQIEKILKTTEELTVIAESLKSKKTKSEEDKKKYDFYCEDVIENEKLIRHFAFSDQVLLMLCKQIIAKDNELIKDSIGNSFKLNEIMPDNEQSVLNKSIEFRFPVLAGNKKDKTNRKIISATFKIKNYGNVRRFLKDRRIGSLLEWMPETDIQLEEIQQELEMTGYEKCRIELFNAIYEFEKGCNSDERFKGFIEEEMKKMETAGKIGYVNHEALLDEFYKIAHIANDDKIVLKNIRNKFSHNEFPDIGVCKELVKENKNFAIQLAEYAKNKYNSYLQLLFNKVSN
ncbi:MAG: type VI-B CRISPR-associated RNA-guided ribonuclease Cas13b [Panacibacter sp.]